MKTQKGITLIALIITIIVMLILVGVSVSVALNTGLFKTAQGVAKNTQLAADAENTLSTGMVTIKDENGENKLVDINTYFTGTAEDPDSGENPGDEDEIIYLVDDPEDATHILEFDGVKYGIKQETTIYMDWYDNFVVGEIGQAKNITELSIGTHITSCLSYGPYLLVRDNGANWTPAFSNGCGNAMEIVCNGSPIYVSEGLTDVTDKSEWQGEMIEIGKFYEITP